MSTKILPHFMVADTCTHDSQQAAQSRAARLSLSLSLGLTSNIPLYSEAESVWTAPGLGVREGAGKACAEDDQPPQVKGAAPRIFVARGQ